MQSLVCANWAVLSPLTDANETVVRHPASDPRASITVSLEMVPRYSEVPCPKTESDDASSVTEVGAADRVPGRTVATRACPSELPGASPGPCWPGSNEVVVLGGAGGSAGPLQVVETVVTPGVETAAA